MEISIDEKSRPCNKDRYCLSVSTYCENKNVSITYARRVNMLSFLIISPNKLRRGEMENTVDIMVTPAYEIIGINTGMDLKRKGYLRNKWREITDSVIITMSR